MMDADNYAEYDDDADNDDADDDDEGKRHQLKVSAPPLARGQFMIMLVMSMDDGRRMMYDV